MTGPLRIAVVTPLPVSGEEGGNERHWRSLAAALNEVGHDAELVGLVSPEADLPEVLSSYRMFHDLDLSWADVVVSGKYPSFMVRHPRHLRHLNHTLRGLYEHYPAHLPADIDPAVVAELDSLGDDVDAVIDWALDRCLADETDPTYAFPGPFARLVVKRLDRIGRDRLSAEATVSEVVAARRDYVDPARSIAVVPPLGDLDQCRPDDDQPADGPPFLFSFGRLDGAKRFDLIMRSFAAARRLPGMRAVELVIAGGGPLADELAAAAPPGVRLVGRLDDDDLDRHLQNAVATILAPIDEDFGLVAAEAMAAGTPVITTADSGGIAEQITHGVDGVIVPPREPLLAAAMRRLATEPALAARMGRAAAAAVDGASWAPLVDLIEETARPIDRRQVLLVSTFAAEHVRNGGERRLRGMAAGLVAHGWQPTILSLANTVPPDQVRRRRTADGVHHVTVGRSTAHLDADFAMSTLAGVPVDDIGCVELWPASPAFLPELERQIGAADVVIASHPYLISAIDRAGSDGVPLVYDAFNVETELKAALLEGRPGAAWFAERVQAAETAAVERSALISATSVDDLASFGADGVVAPNPLHPAVAELRTDDERLAARTRFLDDHGRSDDHRPIVVFVGSDHPPNRAAAERCVDLAAARPDLHVVIAGSVQLDRPGSVTHVGAFADRDLRRLQVMADVIANPVEAGSGTSLKLIDPLALGVPVVSTEVGARGLPASPPIVWISDADAPTMAATIDDVLQSEDERDRRIAAGLAFAQTARADRAVADLVEALDRLAPPDS